VKGVEHDLFRWADKITVRRVADALRVQGQNGPETQSPDVLRAYRNFGKQGLHVQFVNARTDEDLIDFVQRYGPVNGHRQTGPLSPRGSPLEVMESFSGLRREQMVFRAALQLLNGLRQRRDTDAADGLGELVCADSMHLPEATSQRDAFWGLVRWDLEVLRLAKSRGFRGKPRDLRGFLRGLRGAVLRELGWNVLCMMLENFRPVLVPVKDGLIELPARNEAGILPRLYFMLRRDCLYGQEIRICARLDCRKFFKVERNGQTFCLPECSQLQRQRDYWQRKGRFTRVLREAKKRDKKGRSI
jgi:hypothetical protein